MGDFDNDGAMMDVDETLMCKFIKVKPDMKPNGLTKKGTIRCRIHGGWSTGPKTLDGKLKALKNLKNINYEQVTANTRDKYKNYKRVNEWQASNEDLPRQS